jgi:hypothetical protein
MKGFKKVFTVELAKKVPVIYEWPADKTWENVKELGLKSPKDLETYDSRVFETEKEAEAFLERYLKILKALDNKKICKSRDLQTILYKRRYMVLSLMGEKMQTQRSSPRVAKMMSKVKVGEMFNLNDQTFFLTVVLTKVTKVSKDTYQYDFKLP